MVSKRRFSIRTLMVLMAVIAVAIVFRFELHAFIYRWIYLSAFTGFVISFLLSRYFEFRRLRFWFFAAVPFVCLSLYACLARYRVDRAYRDSMFPRTFPYPDRIILQMESFFRTPPEELPPNTIDFHGGMMETMEVIHWTAIIAAVLAGWMLGLGGKAKNNVGSDA